MSVRQYSVRTDDDWQIAVTEYPAQEPAASVSVIICGELGFTQSDYANYANFLRQHGFDVLCFDYRGTGNSQVERSGIAPSLLDWGRQDLSAVIRQSGKNKVDNALVLVGHGLGGFMPGLAPNNDQLYGMLCVTPATGLFGDLTFTQRRLLWFRYCLLQPLRGLLPRQVESPLRNDHSLMPAGLMHEWADWCFGAQAPVNAYGVAQLHLFQSWRKPIRCYSFVADPAEPSRRRHEITRLYPKAQVELMKCPLEEAKGAVKGYAEFFDAGAASALWEESVKWLLRAAPEPVESDLIEI